MQAEVKAASAPPARHAPVRRRKRRWLPYVGAAALVALIVAGLWPQPVPVETAKVVSGPLRSTVNEEGKTRIKQRYTVSAPVAGQLRRVPLKAGAEVEAGKTVLALIDPVAPSMLDARSRALAEARRDTAAANVARAKAAQEFAATELQRAEKLAVEKTISPQELDAARWRATAAAKELVAAEGSLRQAEAELLAFTDDGLSKQDAGNAVVKVTSPTTGRVLRVLEESARTVAAGTPLLEIGNPEDLEVVIEALSRDGAAIAPGTRVELEQWGGPEPLQARVRYVEPAAFTKVSALGVEEQRVNVVADITSPAAIRATVGDNFRVEGRIVMWETNRTIKVPSGALFRHGGAPAVFVVKENRAVRQSVKTGRSSGTETEALEGIKEGDEVILYPGDRIHDGLRVKRLELER